MHIILNVCIVLPKKHDQISVSIEIIEKKQAFLVKMSFLEKDGPNPGQLLQTGGKMNKPYILMRVVHYLIQMQAKSL